ncbi:tryptophan--tRNA ligase [Candidatus Woesebacteria bacterium RIFCSPHIGHO2_01_FULL_44_10]|uniref:Tryptophan--tRNA ligase n=1 Tax=Candidatus Woesebacteria bacterium RIFCSPLOWO2_01_FULL_44_14 TaxID=1802525 RepID=A0A1F8BWK4_9BACT|nr:MAG: tryptophan--tRNA ligase [Candidatus Woesebacteria bacterium RIFCSPHIGHO2_01_FULL_44_10]OGM54996.1 MAG: tryptophan--tRNA ligase [Candidatus Woesebacteria bacterium RIFCSPHIGHO2_12_FULL_44_11]OGM68484.1 MAG: tryptophan--tRNA ligase [Candidatus Woesebacteria bacterium RIFCSPLOWO2_01_FULL_44_14]
MTKKRVLSGIRATGRLHLGNYLGMVKGMVALQGNPDYEPLFMVADLHAMTTPFDPQILKKNIREVVLDYLAAGLDPKSAILFIQSQVPQHVELAYLFSTVVSIARLSHLPTYKEKVKQYPESNTIALLYYPVLMASDILLYKTNSLPVGDDQLPHLEVTGEVAKKMNNLYGTDFPEPKQMKTEGHYVPSLTGEGKMSKSVEGSYVNLTDNLETIKTKLAKVPTDSGRGNKAPEEGGVHTLMTLVELFGGEKKRKEYEKQYQRSGIKYQGLKNELAGAIYEELKPIQEERKKLEKDPEYVEKVLREGAKKARQIASQTVVEVKEKMGLL